MLIFSISSTSLGFESWFFNVDKPFCLTQDGHLHCGVYLPREFCIRQATSMSDRSVFTTTKSAVDTRSAGAQAQRCTHSHKVPIAPFNNQHPLSCSLFSSYQSVSICFAGAFLQIPHQRGLVFSSLAFPPYRLPWPTASRRLKTLMPVRLPTPDISSLGDRWQR